MTNNPFRDINTNLKKQQKEFKLQVACVKHLSSAFPQVLYFHVPNRGGDATDGYFKKLMGAKAGAPDLILTWVPNMGHLDDGTPIRITRCAAIELKAEGGSISPAQNKMLSALRSCGWHTEVCKSPQELHNVLCVWGLQPKHHLIPQVDYRTQNDKHADAFDMYAPEDACD